MKNFTTRKSKLLLKRLPLVLGCIVATSVYAQNVEQVQAIQRESNLKQLNVLKSSFAKNTPSYDVLRQEAKKRNLPFSGEVDGKFFQLERFDKNTGQPIYLSTYNVGAAEGTQTSKLYSDFGVFDLDGTDMKVHEWDGGGVLTTHQEFGDRVTQKDSPIRTNYHATHVAGTLIAAGVEANAKGMAYNAQLDAYDWSNDEEEMAAAAADGALVSNHSYGYIGGFERGSWSGNQGWHWFGGEDDTEYKLYGAYLEYDREWDIIAYNAPYYLPVKAAGNPRGGGPDPGETHYVITGTDDSGREIWEESTKVRQKNGGEDGFDCIIFGTTAKNILVVGAAHKLNGEYSKPSDVKMASFSGFGPVDDGRIKPDITGIGVGLHSTWDSGNDAYNSISGTSMASPNVTGSLILLQELYSKKNAGQLMKSATLKALVTGTANDTGNVGPDYSSGWGLLNAFKAAQTIALNNSYSLIKEIDLNNGDTYTLEVVASGTEPLKATIAWTDPASPVLTDRNTLDDPTKMLVNDLDIKITENGNEYLAWVLDPTNPGEPATKGNNNTDNVEQVLIGNPTAGATYTITVSHKGTLKKTVMNGNNYELQDANSQTFGLVVTGINNDVEKDLALASISTVDAGEFTSSTPVTFTVENKGKKEFSGGRLKYSFIKDEDNSVISEEEVDLETIAPGKTSEKVVNFDLSQSFVDYTIKAEIISTEDQVDLNNKNSIRVFGVIADVTQKGDEYNFGFEQDFNKYGWKSEDLDNNGRTWLKYNDAEISNNGENAAVNFPNLAMGINDWLFSNPIRLKGGKLYRVSFYLRKFQSPNERVTVAIGTEPNSNSMTMIPNSESEAFLGKYTKYSYEFEVPNDEAIYIGFHHETAPDVKSYAIALDDFTVKFSEGKPEANFSVDNNTPTTYDIVTFKDKSATASTQPILSYEWNITPNTFAFVENTNANSQEPKVKFSEEGDYNVSLKVTNSEGEDTEVKDSYIKVKNEEVVAKFTADKTNTYLEREEVINFTNESTGKPAPNTFEWTFTPSEGVEFVDGTSTTSKNPSVKFSKVGKYTVKLKATSEHNEGEVTRAEFINVQQIYSPVTNLDYTFDNNSSELELTWKRPVLLPLYEEDFSGGELPADMTVIDNNYNGYTWQASSYSQAVYSYSWWFSPFDCDDWLLTGKIQSGAELLKFDVKNAYNERFDIYVVEAPTDGSTPTVDYIKANGQIVFTEEAENIRSKFQTESIDIQDKTESDFYIAFHHRSTAADNGLNVGIDNIFIGYKNSENSTDSNSVKSTNSIIDNNNFKTLVQKGEVLITDLKELKQQNGHRPRKELGYVSVPRPSGYEIVKDGNTVENKSDINDLIYNETINEEGIYVYDVYVMYDDGTKSEKKTVTVDLNSMATNDINAEDGLKVFPNPSNGLFNVVAGTDVTELNATVYDLTGKELFKKNFKGNEVELNLTKYPKGVYILSLVDNNGNKKAVKVMIK